MRAWSLSLAFIGLLAVTLRASADDPAVKWLRNLDDAKRIAAEQHKDLLINFTGLSWCPYCKLLDNEVFRQTEFTSAANDFLLVELDYPGSDDRFESPQQKELYDRWKRDYLVQGFPTVVLADMRGTPYAYTGYEKGITPKRFLKQLASYQSLRQSRDQKFSEAENLMGLDRARKLDAAIKVISALLGTKMDRFDDAVLVFYGDAVAEIQRLDADNAAGLKDKYAVRIAAREKPDAYSAVEVEKKLRQFNRTNAEEGIAYVNQILPEVKAESLRWKLEMKRHQYLQLAERWDEALENGRRLQSLVSPTAAQRDRLLEHEVWILSRLDRLDEMSAGFDDLIAKAGDNTQRRIRLLGRKAQHLLSHGTLEQNVEAWQAYRSAAEPGSEHWLSGTQMLKRVLVKNGHHAEAIEVVKEIVARHADDCGDWITLAECQRALGLIDEAQKSLAEAEKKAAPILAKQTDQVGDKRTQEKLQETIAKLRESLGEDRK